MSNNERQKRREKKRSRRGFISFLICAFLLCIAVNLVLSAGDRLETMIVRTGSEEEVIETEGFVFRKQTVISAPDSGYLYCEVDEDQRVKVGETVMYIYKSQINPAVSNELKTIEEEIKKLSGGSLTSDVFSNDTAKIEQSIAQKLKAVPKLGFENRVETVGEIKQQVNTLIEERRIISGEIEPKDKSAQIQELKKKKAELEKQHNIERTIVHSPKAGAFTARIDGMEELLHTDALKKVSVEYLKELDKKDISVKTSDKVESGEKIGKIVDNFGWSVAALIPEDMAEDIDVGDSIKMRFSDIGIETVDTVVSAVSVADGGKVAVTLFTGKYVDMIYSSSKAKIELIKHSYTGFRIPSESIRIVDGKTGVYVIRNDKAHFVPANILYNNKKWAIVSEKFDSGSRSVKLYDELIVSGKNLYDGKVVR